VDLHRPVTYRGLDLTGAALDQAGGEGAIEGIRLTRARFSDVTVHGYTEKRALDDGFNAGDVYLGQRTVALQGEIFAKSKARLFDTLDSVRLVFTPTDAYAEAPWYRGYLPLRFSQATEHTTYWPLGFIDRIINVRPSAQPEFDVEFAAQGSHEGEGYVIPFATRLEAKDPRFYAPLAAVYAMAGTSGTILPVHRGNYPSPVDILLTLPASPSTQCIFTLQGLGTDLTATIPAQAAIRTLRIDGLNRVVTLTVGSTETLRMDLVTFAANKTWPVMEPTPEGDPAQGVEWQATVALGTGSRLFFAEAWA
jgi:hypothetical protein